MQLPTNLLPTNTPAPPHTHPHTGWQPGRQRAAHCPPHPPTSLLCPQTCCSPPDLALSSEATAACSWAWAWPPPFPSAPPLGSLLIKATLVQLLLWSPGWVREAEGWVARTVGELGRGGTGRTAEVGSSTLHLLRACPQGAHSLRAEPPHVLGWGGKEVKAKRQAMQTPRPKQRWGAKQAEAGVLGGAGGRQPGKPCLDLWTGPSSGLKAAPLPPDWGYLRCTGGAPAPPTC